MQPPRNSRDFFFQPTTLLARPQVSLSWIIWSSSSSSARHTDINFRAAAFFWRRHQRRCHNGPRNSDVNLLLLQKPSPSVICNSWGLARKTLPLLACMVARNRGASSISRILPFFSLSFFQSRRSVGRTWVYHKYIRQGLSLDEGGFVSIDACHSRVRHGVGCLHFTHDISSNLVC